MNVCGNMNCFYYETIFSYDEVVMRHEYNYNAQDLILVAFCPSCDERMEDYNPEDFPYYEKRYKHGAIQTETKFPSKKT